MAQKAEPKSLKLWGKIHGTVKDYYIAEGEKEGAAPAGSPGPDEELRGAPGVNKNIYWVTDSVTGAWVELPDTTPTKIRLARQLKLFFTGNLEADVISNPFFFGKEKELLRAQIARISLSTTIVPKGLHKVTEENPRQPVEITEEERKEEKKPAPTFEKLAKLEEWCHFTPNILKASLDLYHPISAED